MYACKAQGSNLCSSDSALKELKKFEVNTLVRVCEATYDKAPVEREGIQVLVSTVVQVSYYKPLALSDYSGTHTHTHTFSQHTLTNSGLLF